MDIVGIIAEFNPLHKGHEALIKFASSRKTSGACVILMSSNFTQRGSPAIVDELTRANVAIKAGADLVLELPFIYSCSAGQDFSRGAVEILGRLGFITHIAFGMEDADFDTEPLINLLLHENEGFQKILRRELNSGASFAKAYSLALESLLPGTHDFIINPNNMLALNYMLEIHRQHYNLNTLPVERKGNFSSKLIRENFSDNSHMLPDYSREALIHNTAHEEYLWPMLANIFIRSKPEDLRKIHGIDEGIENLFLKQWPRSKNLDDFIGRCVCARYTRAYLRRRLVYLLLGLERWEMFGALKAGVPYVRVLAFNDKGRKILREHSHESDIRIITRLKAAEGNVGKYFAQVEFKASQVHKLLLKEND